LPTSRPKFEHAHWASASTACTNGGCFRARSRMKRRPVVALVGGFFGIGT
jgi:hypothetical protein